MKFNNDYHYITEKANKIIEMGFADLDLHSIRIETVISEEQKEENLKLSKTLSGKEWGIRCDEFELIQSKKVEKILDVLAEHFIIYQYKDANIQYHNRKDSNNQNGYEWDLYCNFGNKRSASLSFNDNGKTLEERYKDLNKIKEILKDYEDDSIKINVQYTQNFHIEELNKKVIEVYSNLKDTFINYNGMIGKIKPVEKYNDSYYGTPCQYGFFKKGSRKTFYKLTNMDIITL